MGVTRWTFSSAMRAGMFPARFQPEFPSTESTPSRRYNTGADPLSVTRDGSTSSTISRCMAAEVTSQCSYSPCWVMARSSTESIESSRGRGGLGSSTYDPVPPSGMLVEPADPSDPSVEPSGREPAADPISSTSSSPRDEVSISPPIWAEAGAANPRDRMAARTVAVTVARRRTRVFIGVPSL